MRWNRGYIPRSTAQNPPVPLGWGSAGRGGSVSRVIIDCRPVRLAAALARLGASAVVVGSCARWLTAYPGSALRPLDLDLAVEPSAVPALCEALTALGVSADPAALLRARVARIDSGWGPLDVFVGAVPTSRPVAVQGVRLEVAA